MTRASLLAPAIACAALLAQPTAAQEAAAVDGDLSITVDEGIAPSLLDLLLALEQVDHATLLIGEGARAALAETPCGLTESVLIEGDEVLTFVEELLRWGGFVISELGEADGALIGVHWVRGEDGSNARYRAVDAEWLAKLSGHAALLVETIVELPHLDARQATTSLRALLRAEWCNTMISAGERTILLRGPAKDVAEWVSMLGRLEDIAAAATAEHAGARQALAAPAEEPEVAMQEPAQEPARAREQAPVPEPDPNAPRSALEGAELLLAALSDVGQAHDVKLLKLGADVREDRSGPHVALSFDVVGAGANGLEATAVLLALKDAIQARAPDAEVRFYNTSEVAPEEEQARHKVHANGARVTFPPFVPREAPPALAGAGELKPAFLVRQAAVDPEHEIGIVNLKTKHLGQRDGTQTIEIQVDPVGGKKMYGLSDVRGFLADLDHPDSPFSVSSLTIFDRGRDSGTRYWDFHASVVARTTM
jgi:hypothetical protein